VARAPASAADPDDRFRWHPAARLVDAAGRAQRASGPGRAAIPAEPAAAALAVAMAAVEAGLAFRIGGGDAAPEAGDVPMFETLTSGSTGAPRRVRRTQASWIASFRVNAGLFGIGPGRRVAVAGGLTQSAALYGAIEALHLGAEAYLLAGLRPDRQRAALAARRIDVLHATPAQLRLMLEADGAAVPGLSRVITGGSKLDPATAAGLARLFPAARVSEFYGTAETSFVTLADATTPDGSVGRAYPGVEIALRGGAIHVRSPYLAEGYAAPVAGGAVWQDGWVSVGEVGRIEGGHLFLRGRAGRMVTVADRNVFPEEIEAFLLGLPGVTRAAVLPRPDPRRGHVIEAAVTGGDAGAILAACRARLGPLVAPRRLHLVADWPLLPSGKTDLAALDRLVGRLSAPPQG
jgi:long-chain acyl-CoA synthetase